MLSDILLQRPKRTSRNLMDVFPGISGVLPKLHTHTHIVHFAKCNNKFQENLSGFHREIYIRLLL